MFDQWFESYQSFICHYARLAQQSGVEQLCIGTELSGTTHRERDWAAIVEAIKQEYGGRLVYASNYGGEESEITWWRLIDFIGVDAYYPLSNGVGASLQALVDAWTARGYVSLLRSLSDRYGKKIVITEIGYRSIAGASTNPAQWGNRGQVDVFEQERCYEAAFVALWQEPWLAGMYWWVWEADPQIGGLKDMNYTPNGKPAEEVLRRFYNLGF